MRQRGGTIRRLARGHQRPFGRSCTIVAKINAAIEAVLKDPETLDRLKTFGFDPISGSPAEADTYFRAEVTKWGEMVKALGLSIN
jgi:tripartite-type tricarboxylate transporter receptor subunit TctC